MKVPCKDCLILPRCRTRSVRASIRHCSILDSYIEKHSRRHRPNSIRLILSSAMYEVEQILEPGRYAP